MYFAKSLCSWVLQACTSSLSRSKVLKLLIKFMKHPSNFLKSEQILYKDIICVVNNVSHMSYMLPLGLNQ